MKVLESDVVFDMKTTPHICIPLEPCQLVAKHHERDHRLAIPVSTAKRPREAYENMQADLARSFSANSINEQRQIERHLPPYKSVKSQYYRKINKRYPTLHGIGDPGSVWAELTQTWESRNNVNSDDRYVLFEQAQPPFLILASAQDLRTLHDSRHWVCDGTFDFCPPQFSQLYSIHGFKRGEGLPLVAGLLPDKTRATYTKFFEVVRTALISACGDVGELRFGHFDFEMVAISTFEVTFPGAESKGCLFHFAHCVIRKMAQLGLRELYGDIQRPAFRRWARRLVSLALLPERLVMPHWTTSLKGQTPMTGTPRLDAAITEFSSYFERQWLVSPRQVALWNHFKDEDNLRTTNHAEGWHRSLSSRFQCQPRMPLGKFMVDFQKNIHHMTQTPDITPDTSQRHSQHLEPPLG
ncbi:uncharacterized protein LOC120836087 [Ixodes scapularis]|uniref:uncharacterized protein LOC120836087 n=1 Tax=Ixodes scapularis TaxID=6945 RepID=UPI001C38B595|nr:uncharacterized protein LOC120836087 [Ixodes scapularis]